uniref:Lipopolysaccharide biosynthesis protein n=1 Tax=Desertifilum tharense IPPAS B-1220 TaxID=1781255 RepID=A0ACD5GVB2_9CYAN
MNFVQALIGKVKNKFQSKFVQNVGWLGGSEFINRVIRLGATVILARFLTEYDYGLAAIVLTVREFTQVFTRVGIGLKIIQVDPENLEELCNSAYWLNWLIFVGVFVVQCLAAFPVAWIYRDNSLILPICASGLIYLILPLSSVQFALIHRENRLEVTALNNTIQHSISNILSGVLAFFGFGMWAIVLPGVLVAPIWVYIYCSNHSWQPTSGFTTKHWDELFNFGRNILGVEMLKTLRNNLDYLIVGRFISIEQLGLYYFAFNAGLGISLSIIMALNSALLPHLCAVRAEWERFRHRYFKSLKGIAVAIIPLVLLQSSLAPFYVPIVFGEKWVPAIPILIFVCLSAIPRPFADAASQLLIAVDKPHIDLRWNVIFTLTFTAALLVGVSWQALGVAIAVFLVHTICLPLYTFWASYHVFHKRAVVTAQD